MVCRSFAEDFQKMGGKIFLNYEVVNFVEMAESTDNVESSPISVQSKNKVISMIIN